ncbi:MAG: hypothetical protein ACYSTY_12390 [Planctomycetota bacterium]
MSAFAWAILLLGVASCIVCFLSVTHVLPVTLLVYLAWGVGAFAVAVLGLVAVIRIAVSRGRLTGRRQALIGIGLGLGGFLAFDLELTGLRCRVYESARVQACRERQRAIYEAIIMYAGVWEDQYPAADSEAEALSLLVSLGYVESASLFVCPGSRQVRAKGPPEEVRLDASTCSYAYSMNCTAWSRRGSALLGDRSAESHCYEVRTIHGGILRRYGYYRPPGQGVNVTYNDGRVEFHYFKTHGELPDLTAYEQDGYPPGDRIYERDPAFDIGNDSWLRFRE